MKTLSLTDSLPLVVSISFNLWSQIVFLYTTSVQVKFYVLHQPLLWLVTKVGVGGQNAMH